MPNPESHICAILNRLPKSVGLFEICPGDEKCEFYIVKIVLVLTILIPAVLKLNKVYKRFLFSRFLCGVLVSNVIFGIAHRLALKLHYF